MPSLWRCYAWGLAAVLLAFGSGALLNWLLPFWLMLPVGIICGYVIGQAVMTRLFEGLPPSDEPDTIDPSTTEGPE